MKNQQIYLVSVTRQDLPTGVQAVQSAHAYINFTQEHPDITKKWFEESNYLWMASVKDEFELEDLAHKFEENNIKISRFYEPDLNSQLTAIAIEPSDYTRKIASKLKKMLQ